MEVSRFSMNAASATQAQQSMDSLWVSRARWASCCISMVLGVSGAPGCLMMGREIGQKLLLDGCDPTFGNGEARR